MARVGVEVAIIGAARKGAGAGAGVRMVIHYNFPRRTRGGAVEGRVTTRVQGGRFARSSILGNGRARRSGRVKL